MKTYYNKTLSTFEDPAKQVGWLSKRTQETRFMMLCEISHLEGCAVLDVGCGIGGLYAYLQEHHQGCDYVGIDNHPGMIAKAKENYPNACFQELNFLDSTFQVRPDFVFASGPFNGIAENQMAYIKEAIDHMYDVAHQGVAFNLLSAYAPKSEQAQSKHFYYYDPQEILGYCLSKTRYVSLYHHYLPNDFTVHMYKT